MLYFHSLVCFLDCSNAIQHKEGTPCLPKALLESVTYPVKNFCSLERACFMQPESFKGETMFLESGFQTCLDSFFANMG